MSQLAFLFVLGKLSISHEQKRGQKVGLQIDLKGMFMSASLSGAKGQCCHPLNIYCISNLWSSLLMEGRDGMIIQNSTKFQVIYI